MVIKILDHILRCSTNKDGEKIFNIIKPLLDDNKNVNVSFKDIDSVTTSFINSAFIPLLDDFSFEYIKEHLTFSNTIRYINDLIKKRFKFEVERNQYTKNLCSDSSYSTV